MEVVLLMGLKIMIVSDHYPPYIGGAHRQSQLLARELSRRGHDISVVTVWQQGTSDRDDSEGFSVYRLHQLRTLIPGLVQDTKQRHQPPFPDPVTVWELRRILKDVQPELIHCYGWFGYSCALALTGQRIPMVLAARDYAYSCARRTMVFNGQEICSGPTFFKCIRCSTKLYGAFKGFLTTIGVAASMPLLLEKTQGMQYISSYTKEIMQRDFWKFSESNQSKYPRKIEETIIPSFMVREDQIEDDTGDPEIQPYIDQLPEQPFILFVGALRRVKGVYQLLEAYQALKSPPPLVLIGTLEADSPKTFPAGVLILQNFPHKAVYKAWDRSLFGVFPSLWAEPLGSVVYEAMSRGRAVIGTKPGGHTDMILPGKTGILVPVGDVQALKNAMQTLMNDDQLRTQYGIAARDFSSQFTSNVTIPKFEKFFETVVNNYASSARGRS